MFQGVRGEPGELIPTGSPLGGKLISAKKKPIIHLSVLKIFQLLLKEKETLI